MYSIHHVAYSINNPDSRLIPSNRKTSLCSGSSGVSPHTRNKIHDMGVLNGLRFDLNFDNDFKKSLMKQTKNTKFIKCCQLDFSLKTITQNMYHLFSCY